MSIEIDNLEDCSLEWDRKRGVIYVHSKATGHTVLRVCSLPVPRASLPSIGEYGNSIDITVLDKSGVGYTG